ncbi:hypothetical protein SAMN05216359_102505 [Roseateles sp. YR242]|uniref:hypothetical protein n=1 Tax=Roseateles sp. YR242 TaxID=1855305 RepID=UPI0008C671A9|nr:hypothetical protein [Roseateles sp. YR242]SEK63989.1 hypothetical protein SAMN05216359_102505 [Roseateles sp. YR242]
MKWSRPVLDKLAKVRDVRLRLAEAAVSREDRALDARLVEEEQAGEALTEGRQRSEQAAQAADDALVARSTGGRSGITQWRVDRTRAKRIVEDAQEALSAACASTERQRGMCADTRAQWRELRFDVERLKALIEHGAKPPGSR